MTDNQETTGSLINLSAQEEAAPQEAPMAIHEPAPGEEAAPAEAAASS
jgi:hypothetical protein